MAITPLDNDEVLSVIYLGGKVSPGKVTLSGHDRNPDWDVKKAKGSTGASTVLNDPSPPGSFEALFELASDDVAYDGEDDFTKWDEFQALIESTTSGPKPFALPIYHPDLARNHYVAVANGGIGGMVYDGKGGASVKVKFQELRPPKPKKAAKAITKPAAGKAAKPDPNAAAKAERDALLREAMKP